MAGAETPCPISSSVSGELIRRFARPAPAPSAPVAVDTVAEANEFITRHSGAAVPGEVVIAEGLSLREFFRLHGGRLGADPHIVEPENRYGLFGKEGVHCDAAIKAIFTTGLTRGRLEEVAREAANSSERALTSVQERAAWVERTLIGFDKQVEKKEVYLVNIDLEAPAITLRPEDLVFAPDELSIAS